MPDRLTADWPPIDDWSTAYRPPIHRPPPTDRLSIDRPPNRTATDWPPTYRPTIDRRPPDRLLIDWLSTEPQSILIVSTHSANHAKKTRPQPGFLGIVYRLSIKHQKFDAVVCTVRLSVDCRVRQSPWIASTRHNRTGLTDSLISTP